VPPVGSLEAIPRGAPVNPPAGAPAGSAVAPPELRVHLPAPDYTRPLLEPGAEPRERILQQLAVLYGRKRAEACWPELLRLMRVYHAHKTPEMLEADRSFEPPERFTEKDVVLITYGDLLHAPGRRPLELLAEFAGRFGRGFVNTIHLLPFFPYSSDRGFAVVDYEEVDPRLGSWDDIEQLGRRFRLMFDGVFNHVSSKSGWFQSFLNGRPGYQDYFIAFSTKDAIDKDHLRLILRPRTSDLLTSFRTLNGAKWVWTTFGPDQVDLNYKNEEVLLRIVEVLLLYVRHGADVVRLDAITYLWRELGTRCAFLKEGHALVKLFRAVLDAVAPRVALITETNVPHAENVGYFGDGRDEAQLVYNFALPPLLVHALHTADATVLTEWARTLRVPLPSASFFNFLDSHDGIGLMGVRDILAPADIDRMLEQVKQHGGLASYRDNGDGTRTPYELNITWYSALNREDAGEPLELQVARFIASRAIALALAGVPGIYLPSVFGSKNDSDAVRAGAEARAINRDTIDVPALLSLLGDRRTWASKVARRFGRLIRTRIGAPAFHPQAPQRVLAGNDAVFAVLRTARDGRQRVLALASVSPQVQTVSYALKELGTSARSWHDLVSARRFEAADGALSLRLRPYDVVWLANS
jgi:sucrose phosphorylase